MKKYIWQLITVINTLALIITIQLLVRANQHNTAHSNEIAQIKVDMASLLSTVDKPLVVAIPSKPVIHTNVVYLQEPVGTIKYSAQHKAGMMTEAASRQRR